MKKISVIIILLSCSILTGFSQTQELNYIKTTSYLNEDNTRKVTSVSYIDAFGRPLQDLVLNASPLENDIVQTYQYDDLGRVIKSYLPFTDNGGQDGEFVDDAVNLQASFYQSQNIPGDDIPYATAEYDNSPFNRIIKQSIPGEDINTVNISSEFTPAGGIDLWIVNDNDKLIKSGTYAGNILMKFTGKDADGKKIYVYKDNTGSVLLKETADANGSVITKTRYVYDKYGQIRYVLSPAAVSKMTGTTYDINSTHVKQYCYYYEYDYKHQLITKQLPGKDPIYLRYDSKYRLRMTQDGNQRLDDKWMFINYDYYGRTASTGLGHIDNDTIIQDTIIILPDKGITAFLTYQFYDNYDFIENPDLQFNASLAYHEKFDRIRGKSTGSKVRVMLPDEEKWLSSVVYYDKYGRVIQTISQNNLGGYDIVSNEYNFAGELLKSKHKHKIEYKDPKYLVYLYTYDPVGRLKKVELSQFEDESSLIVINRMFYNELGQIVENRIHSENGYEFLQYVKYGYNIKGAITNINDPESLGNDLFGMKLYYDDEVGTYGNETYKDGKISAIQWNSENLKQVQTYMYEYDDLNRLTKAIFVPEERYDVNISYDLNGNITYLDRKGEIITKTISDRFSPPSEINGYSLIDDLTYTYNGNRLTSVNDAIGEINTQLNNDFRDVSSKIGFNEYYYDANGNMTKDLNKGINLVTYNHLNQPTEVQKSADDKTVYLYTATGVKLKTEIYQEGKLQTTTDYSGAYVYENDEMSFINIPGGRITYTRKKDVLEKKYEYHLTDHLGNVRVTFSKNNDGNAEILQEDHYYPFGMRMNGMHVTNTDLINKYLYNGKELQDQTNYLDYGFRQMDPQLGRWHVVDALAELYTSESPYAYVENNPVNFIDILGLKRGDPKYPSRNRSYSEYEFTPDFAGFLGQFGGGGGGFGYGSGLVMNGTYGSFRQTGSGHHGGGRRRSASSLMNNSPNINNGIPPHFNNWNNSVNTYAESVWVWDGDDKDPRWEDAKEDNVQEAMAPAIPLVLAGLEMLFAALVIKKAIDETKVHDNSNSNTKQHLVYEIYGVKRKGVGGILGTEETLKFGISSRPDYITKDGNPRPQLQVNAFRKDPKLFQKFSDIDYRIVARNIPGRIKAKIIEQALVTQFFGWYLRRPLRQWYPLPDQLRNN